MMESILRWWKVFDLGLEMPSEVKEGQTDTKKVGKRDRKKERKKGGAEQWRFGYLGSGEPDRRLELPS